MPRAQKLKVYRTPIGFHDAYVAAPSQKAALKAWGSDANLFARGVAEQVTDAALTKEPLAHPGQVIRKLRGTAEEQLAALPAQRAKAGKPKPTPKPKPKPRPSRDALDAAEKAIADEDRRHANERKKLDAQLDRARTSYERAMERWRAEAER